MGGESRQGVDLVEPDLTAVLIVKNIHSGQAIGVNSRASLQGNRLNLSAHLVGKWGWNQRLAAAFGVFGVVVIPIGIKADFAHHGRLELLPSEYGAFQLACGDPTFHNEAGVMACRFLQARKQLVSVTSFADPNG